MSPSPSPKPTENEKIGNTLKHKLDPHYSEHSEEKVARIEESPMDVSYPNGLTEEDIQLMNYNYEQCVKIKEILFETHKNIFINLDIMQNPLDALDLHFCGICRIYLGQFQNVTLSKVMFHFHCKVNHNFDCSFNPCKCLMYHNNEVQQLRENRLNSQ